MLQQTIEQGVDLETARWQARVDLAAAHRLCVMHGFNEGIFNHLTFRVPGTNNRYYQIPFGLYWSEVTTSNAHATASTRRSTGSPSTPARCSTPTCRSRARSPG